MELEEAIKRLTLKATTSSAEAPDYPNCIVMKKDLITILNHITKQEKMIEYMVNWINDHEDSFEGCHENEKCGDDYISCEQCIKQYFEKKAEETNNE